MYDETKKEKDAMVMKYAMSEQKRYVWVLQVGKGNVREEYTNKR